MLIALRKSQEFACCWPARQWSCQSKES